MTADPITRASRKPRKGRDRCSAHRRDGQQCQAPAIPGGTVCRRHGGGAPQVRIAARRLVLMERLHEAYQAWQEIRAEEHTPGQLCSERELDAFARIATAERELEQFEDDLTLIRLMRMEIRDPGTPEIRRMLLQAARDRLDGRPWKSPLRR